MSEIIFEDEYIMAAVKEAGEISQSHGEEDFSALYGGHIINRLDRPVGGIVLIAKTADSAAKMSELLQKGGITKKYLGVICGKCPQSAELTDYIMVNRRLNLSKLVNKGSSGAKEARLKIESLKEKDNLTLAEITLYTGRHHQIRCQLAGHNMPLWGDTKYNPDFRHKRGVLPGLFSYKMTFIHPFTGKEVRLEAIPHYGIFSKFFTEA